MSSHQYQIVTYRLDKKLLSQQTTFKLKNRYQFAVDTATTNSLRKIASLARAGGASQLPANKCI